MTRGSRFTPRSRVVLAAVILIGLAALLAGRLLDSSGAVAQAAVRPPAAEVPSPTAVDLQHLTIPCWSCPGASDWPLAFRTDLDELAPLGTGSGNAAAFFAAFAKPDGPRFAEAVAADARRIDAPPVGKVLPADDPLLLEAEPWCDQATMRFYPDVFPFGGATTRLPNLLFALTLARSWVHRGMQEDSYDAAMADFRRVVRLGRLLRQEDAVLINDLVGLACIRIGVEAIYDRARAAGKLDLALAAAVAAGEAPAQKLLTAARVTSVEIAPYLHGDGAEDYTLELPEERLDALVALATTCPDRRFRGEAVMSLQIVAKLGSPAQVERARQVMDDLAASDDPVTAAMVRSFLARPLTKTDLKEASRTAR